ncbi:hypothetical protein KSP39_PZI001424 [Platanthera zijinensis]|uniref:Uncharacterized protein n=1 Tax=Platanthera zijinensis TaxID=2320716 RepID=A0AAP0GG79_9ASPA
MCDAFKNLENTCLAIIGSLPPFAGFFTPLQAVLNSRGRIASDIDVSSSSSPDICTKGAAMVIGTTGSVLLMAVYREAAFLEIISGKQFSQYLKSPSDLPPLHEFDWSRSGEKPRRSARISKKAKAVSPLQPEPQSKRNMPSRSPSNLRTNDTNVEAAPGDEQEHEATKTENAKDEPICIGGESLERIKGAELLLLGRRQTLE